MSATITAPARPLCVDMDGTLLATDVLWESVMLLGRKHPARLALLPVWLLKGKAALKKRLAQEVLPDPAMLPYRQDVLRLLKSEAAAGRELVLATASDQAIATRVADHLGIFSAVLSSDGSTNLSGLNKLAALNKYSADGFDYMGNSKDDLPLWKAAEESILVDPPAAVLRAAQREASVQQVLRSRSSKAYAVFKALRVHQWVKNGLLLVPLLVGHKIGDPTAVLKAAFAFLAFSLCASAVYVLNDLIDLEADRAHPRKRYRPFAAGTLQIPTGLALVPLLLVGSFAIASIFVSPLFTLILSGYLAVTTAYSLYIKRVLLLDVFLLAGLYTLRVIAGGVATGISISPWLAAFSMFFFTSLAFMKRYSELRLLQAQQQTRSKRRDYTVGDMELVRTVGPASGYVSVLVLALYVNSPDVLELYARPGALWLVMPIVLYWITRAWFLAHRGEITDDPIIFTVKDRASYLAGLLIAALAVIATLW